MIYNSSKNHTSIYHLSDIENHQKHQIGLLEKISAQLTYVPFKIRNAF